jgi:predicted acetyltransferase
VAGQHSASTVRNAASEEAIRGIELIRPALEHLPGYIGALERGWSPDTERDEARFDELRDIRQSPEKFLQLLDDPAAAGRPIQLPDGTLVPRLPGFRRWIWDGEFCGSVGFRWTPGSAALPPTCLGHIGYSVVPWKRGRGYAKAALARILPEARERGLPHVDIVTDVDNVASQRVVLANGGVLLERFAKGPHYGAKEGLRFRIALQ